MICDIVGRNEGSKLQHETHNFHHRSVIREHVALLLGRSGIRPLAILNMTARKLMSW